MFSYISLDYINAWWPVLGSSLILKIDHFIAGLCAILVWFWEIECITHFRPLSSQRLSYVNIFNINRNLLTQAFTWKWNSLCPIFDKCTREVWVGISIFNLISLFFIVKILFSQLNFVWYKCLVLIQTYSRTIVDLNYTHL